MVGGYFEGKPVLLLHHIGAKSGTERVSPLMYNTDGDQLVIFASKAGAETNPDWFHNLRANPDVEVEVGAEQFPVKAKAVEGAERERLWDRQKAEFDQFAGYEAGSTYKVTKLVGESDAGIEDAVRIALRTSASRVHGQTWRHITDLRANIGEVDRWQVEVEVAFKSTSRRGRRVSSGGRACQGLSTGSATAYGGRRPR